MLVQLVQKRLCMKTAIAAAVVALLAAPAFADAPKTDAPKVVRGETIVIQGQAPPMVAPKPKKRYHRIAPAYSDAAIEHDVWAKAWLLLDVDEQGNVARVKLVKKAGYDLDQIAIDRAFSMKFEPAQDGWHHPVHAMLLTPVEWPSYWWLIAREGLATKVPDYVVNVRCAGTGPLNLGSVHPSLRDCTPPPDRKTIDAAPWIARK